MKKLICLFVAIVFVFAFSACGKSAPNNEPDMQSSLPGANLVKDTSDDESVEVSSDVLEHAKSFIGKEFSDFVAEFGEPNSIDYAPSCLGDGEDGQMEYDGFVVTTYKDGDSEIINDVA